MNTKIILPIATAFVSLIAPLSFSRAERGDVIKDLNSSVSATANERLDEIALQQAKDAGLALINASIARLDQAEESVSNNSAIEASTKKILLESMNNAEAALINYKNQLKSADSIDDVREINQQLVQYLKENKDVIRKNIQTAITTIGVDALEKAKEMEQQIEQLLKVLKVTCPSEADTIAELEDQLAQLEQEIIELETALNSYDEAAIKSQLATINELGSEIIDNLEEIERSCNLP